jgi:hypothetical protein
MKLGSQENPWKITPDDWLENGVPWGDYCECSQCGLVARSTNTFDYYADGPGMAMRCECCTLGRHREQANVSDAIAAKIIAEDN